MLATYEIPVLPDLALSKYQLSGNGGISGALQSHSTFLRQWHGICTELNLSAHLLYVFDPQRSKGHRLRVFFILQGDKEDLVTAQPLMSNNPLCEFYVFARSSIPKLSFKSGATLIKNERVDSLFNALSNTTRDVHYVPECEINEDTRLIELIKIMQVVGTSTSPETRSQHACAFRLDLFPAQDEAETRSAFDPLKKALQGEFDIKLTDESKGIRRDSHVDQICKVFDDWLTAVETTPHFRANIYAFANETYQAKLILNAVSSEILSKGRFSIAPIKPDKDDLHRCTSRLEETPRTYCRFSDAATLASWPTTYCLNEIEPFFRLPILNDGETADLPKETAPSERAEGIPFGETADGLNVLFPIEKLPRHAFFTGMPGSGKTNTMLHLATIIHERGIPFLALEPAKKEYRELLTLPSMQDVFLFSPHVSSAFPLQVNPLEFPVGVRVSEHINALLEVFQGSFVLEGPTYKFLSSSIQNAYKRKGWDAEDVREDQETREFPTLRDVYGGIETEVESSTYDPEIKGNVRSFIQVRLGGLMERDAGELFDAAQSTLSPEQWITESAIVELEVLGEQAKNFFVLLICQYILETLRSQPKALPNMPVRHVMFIEEAHNIIASDSQQASPDSMNPKVSATACIVKMLAEVRALREAIVISDQLPTTLAAEVTKNTGLKLVHRLAAQDDREVIGSAISASPLQVSQINELATGEAFIHYEGILKPFRIRIPQWRAANSGIDISSDAELAAYRANTPHTRWALSVSLLNWADRFLSPLECSAEIATALQTSAIAKEIETEKKESLIDRTTLREEVKRARRSLEKKRVTWCFAKGALGEEFEMVEARLFALENLINIVA